MNTSDMTYDQIQHHIQAGRTLRAHAVREMFAALIRALRPAGQTDAVAKPV